MAICFPPANTAIPLCGLCSAIRAAQPSADTQPLAGLRQLLISSTLAVVGIKQRGRNQRKAACMRTAQSDDDHSILVRMWTRAMGMWHWLVGRVGWGWTYGSKVFSNHNATMVL